MRTPGLSTPASTASPTPWPTTTWGAVYITWQTHVDRPRRVPRGRRRGGLHQLPEPAARRRPPSRCPETWPAEMKIDVPGAKDDRNRLTSPTSTTTTPAPGPQEPPAETEDRRESAPSRSTMGWPGSTCLPRNDEFTIRFVPDTGVRPQPGRGRASWRRNWAAISRPSTRSDLSIGGSTPSGTFGDGSRRRARGSRFASLRRERENEECATWAYQWETGSVVGNGEERFRPC